MSLTICLLITLLDSPKYAVREQSQACLIKIGAPAMPYLEEKKWTNSPERCMRIGYILDTLEEEERLRKIWGTWPYIDSLPYSFPYRAAIIDYYKKIAIDAGAAWCTHDPVTGRVEDWPCDLLAARLWFSDLMGDGLDPGCIQPLLTVMSNRSFHYHTNRFWPE